jgi:DNA-binding NarL/FixJ family response regulator
MSKKRARILLADDNQVMLSTITLILQADFDVVGTVPNGEALLEAAFQLQPDVIVTDISMPKLSGLAAARKIRGSLPRIKLIFLTMHGNSGYRRQALELGAAGYVLKTAAGEELTRAIREALAAAEELR